jgi:GNAT superfamily N-acetyltransferase
LTIAVRIQRVPAAEIDLQTAIEGAAVTRAELAELQPSQVPPSPEGWMLARRHGHADLPSEAVWLARDDAGTLVGHATLEVSPWDNPEMAMVFCSVTPAACGAGVGTALLDAQLRLAAELGRTNLLTFCEPESVRTRFLGDHGFTVVQRQAQRRLDPRRLDLTNVRALADEAAAHAGDYELVRLDGPAPDNLLPGLTTLFEAINDAPTDDMEIEPDTFSAERLRGYDTAMSHRRQHVYRLMARHRRTGEWAGHTILCVDETRPGYAVQEDTSVVRSHRGHRLGMWLKASMLLWMHDEHPELTAIDTWNAATNAHMIAVNEALGCEVSQLGVAMQRLL